MFMPEELEYIKKLTNKGIHGKEGLPQEIFEFISALTPIPNVDLLIINDEKQILLAWRDDKFYENGWHLPGGCIRYEETMYDRIKKTAREELGCEVTFDENPTAVKDALRGQNSNLENSYVRGHNLTILYRCYLPKNYDVVQAQSRKEHENGYLKWFSEIPNNLLKIHSCYGDILKNEMEKGDNVNGKMEK